MKPSTALNGKRWPKLSRTLDIPCAGCSIVHILQDRGQWCQASRLLLLDYDSQNWEVMPKLANAFETSALVLRSYV